MAATTLKMTPEMLRKMERLRNALNAGNVPHEVSYVKARIAEAQKRAEGLCVLFGGIPDQSAIDEWLYWKFELDGAYVRAIQAA